MSNAARAATSLEKILHDLLMAGGSIECKGYDHIPAKDTLNPDILEALRLKFITVSRTYTLTNRGRMVLAAPPSGEPR